MSLIRIVVIAAALALTATAPARAEAVRADILETLEFSAYHQRQDARGAMAMAPGQASTRRSTNVLTFNPYRFGGH